MKFNLEFFKEKLGKLKEFVGKLSKKAKIVSVATAVLIIAAAIVIALILNNRSYVPLFSEMSEDEAAQIVSKLQEDGVDYEYKGNGTVMVEESQADAARAALVYEGYPSSGFTYDVFTENAGGMATDSERRTYKLYELQNRIGATIGLFDGVKDAKVTIALGENQRYVLEDDSEDKAASSASVVVTMKDGAQLESKQARAIQRLVAKSVPNMEMDDVAVFDENGIELSDDEQATGSTEAELQKIVEKKIEQKVVNLLTPFYGDGNVRVAANGKLNMNRMIREATTYTTPDKIDEQDKTGIVEHESGSRYNGDGGTAGGVVGTENNADVPQYTQGAGNNSAYDNETYDRDYLVNQVKEQTEIDPGVMDDLTIAVSINGRNYGELTGTEVRELVSNATGIEPEFRQEKITIVAAPFYTDEKEIAGGLRQFFADNWLIIAIAAAAALVLLLLIIILIKRRAAKRAAAEDAEEETIVPVVQEPKQNDIDILNIQNDRSRELRENIREFTDTNPEISAQMLRIWLNGGNDNDN